MSGKKTNELPSVGLGQPDNKFFVLKTLIDLEL
jgi:hypothetical protein